MWSDYKAVPLAEGLKQLSRLNRPDRPTPTQPVKYLPSFQAARHPNCIEGLNNRFSVLSVGNSSFQPPDAAKIKLEMRHRLVVFFFFF
jgi:hypothetical protein